MTGRVYFTESINRSAVTRRKSGSPGRIRTSDQVINSHLLYR